MMRQIIFFIFLFLLPIVSSQLSPIENSNIRIPVDAEAPEIIIIEPKNISYNNVTPLLVNYTVIDITHDSTWYSLNDQENITITKEFHLSLPEGQYLLKIYANDSLKRVNFSSLIFIIDNSVSLCGNFLCDATESCSICPQDCGSCPPQERNKGGGDGGVEIPTKKENITGPIENMTIPPRVPINLTTPPIEFLNLRFNNYLLPIIIIVILGIIIIVAYYIKAKQDEQKTINTKKSAMKNGKR